MAKFYGEIGYGTTAETAPGVYKDVITERKLYGDELVTARGLQAGEPVNNDLTTNTSISVVADAFAYEHFFAIRYVKWMGAYWLVTNVDVKRPRLILKLGGMYNGPRATVAP